jgi:hypothetical protein
MQDDWTQAVECEFTGGDARFDFPIRPLGPGKLMGVILIGFSVVFDWQPAHLFWQTFAHGPQSHSGGAFEVFNLGFSALFLLAGLIPAGIGLVILFGRSRVEWRDGRLRSAERLGPFSWTRRLPKKPIAKLLAAAGLARNQGGTVAPKATPNFSALIVLFADGSKQWLVLGYPESWVLGVAQRLQEYVGGMAVPGKPVQVQVVANVDAYVNDSEVLHPPANSPAQVSGSGNTLRVFLPPLGLWRATQGFFLFGLAWAGLTTCFVISVVRSAINHDGHPAMPVPMVLVFAAIGGGMLAVAVQLGRRTVELVVAGGQLRVTFKGPVRITQKSWSQADIGSIRVGNSNVSVNKRILPELQVHPRTGKKQGMLAGREEQELLWLATRLRQVLQVPANGGEG